jgi:peptide/nickel transport system ATP-binding protein
MTDDILSVRNLSVEYNTRLGVLDAVNNINLDIKRGEVLGLVGESGCGKSTLGKALLRMIPEPGIISSGELYFYGGEDTWFEGTDLMLLNEDQIRQVRGKYISMIFQDPMTSLNPVQKIVEHLTETVRTHEPKVSKKAARARAEELVDRLGIRSERIDDYPHQLSGGMRQRVMISLALSLRAQLVIADEATTSLDVIVEAQFLDLLKELCEEFGLTILLITHNIGIVAQLANRVAVMYAGRLAELGDVHSLFASPKHPYAEGLLNAVPHIKLEGDELYKMPGAPPNLIDPPPGCRFHPRCPQAMQICTTDTPPFEDHGDEHMTACWLHDEKLKQRMP